MANRTIETGPRSGTISRSLSGELSRDRTSKACKRCQRQKLKCDTEKPCLLCRRAGVECEVSRGVVWKAQLQPSHPRSKRQKRKQATSEPCQSLNTSLLQFMPSNDEAGHLRESDSIAGATQHSRSGTPNSSYPDSSTLDLVKEAFDFHQSDDLATSVTSSLPRGRPPRIPNTVNSARTHSQAAGIGRLSKNRDGASFESTNPHDRGFPTKTPIGLQLRSRTVAALLDVLPKEQVALDLLINTYFDRVHWFMLVFHQDIFRERVRNLVPRPDVQAANSDSDFSFACTILIVTAMGLQYTCDYRKRRLAQLGVEPEKLLLELLSTIKAVFFDLVAIGSLESVQVCVLLGSFYLFHGCPGPALPVISCGLRIAQGIGLHQRNASRNSKSSLEEHDTAEGNRCWLALFEVDRFCSMVYGLPISFAYEDCDMELLLLSPRGGQVSQSRVMSPPHRNSMLLLYKRHMAEFSIILTEILSELYRPTSKWNKEHLAAASSLGSQTLPLSKKINDLDSKVRNWYKNVHVLLHLDSNAESAQRAYTSAEAMDEDIGGNGERFEHHILRMQAITMKFAFENAIIMTHRPLLSLQAARSFQSKNDQETSRTETPNPYKISIEACRSAALNTAAIGSFPIFEEALDTYAASFVGIHIFTAGVVLCLIASFEPMTSQAHEAKAGIQKLMAMQRKLRGRSVIAAQGFEILQKVVSLVVERELREMLGEGGSKGSVPRIRNDEPPHDRSRQNITDPVPVPEISGMDNCATQDSQPSLGVGSNEADMLDLLPSQFEIGMDPAFLNHASTNLVNDESSLMDDYQFHLGDLSADIEQGWIWDPTWFGHI